MRHYACAIISGHVTRRLVAQHRYGYICAVVAAAAAAVPSVCLWCMYCVCVCVCVCAAVVCIQ